MGLANGDPVACGGYKHEDGFKNECYRQDPIHFGTKELQGIHCKT